jgi:hypothetical protein
MRNLKPLILLLLMIALAALPAGCASAPSPAPTAGITTAPPTAAPAAETPSAPPAEIPEATDAPQEEHPSPTLEDGEITDEEFHCTISIACAMILNNMDKCDPDKRELVPEDGWLLEPTEVVFYGGESVFNVLQRTCRQKKIHFEFSNTPIYNSAYIEGIGNLYERDVGELSGWMYSVNDWFPNYGCARYALKDGDVIQWVYTCDLGADVGDDYMAQTDE